MPGGRATWMLIAVAAVVVAVITLTSGSSREDIARDRAFVRYLDLRYDLGGDLRFQNATTSLLIDMQQSDVERCAAAEGVEFSWVDFSERAASTPLDAPLLANPLGASSDPLRPIDGELVETLGMGLERRAIEVEILERAVVDLTAGDDEARVLRSCLAEQEWIDTRPSLAQELDAALEVGLRSVYGLIDTRDQIYARCMQDRGLDTRRPGDFREEVGFLIAEYRAAWDDAPIDGASAGPEWSAVREQEISLSVDEAACREEMIGDHWQQLADVLERYDQEFSDEREALLMDWRELLEQ